MKFEIKLDWPWILRKVRIAFLVGVFWALHTYVGAVWGFMWLAYFILNDLSDIEIVMEESRDQREEALRSFAPVKRSKF